MDRSVMLREGNGVAERPVVVSNQGMMPPPPPDQPNHSPRTSPPRVPPTSTDASPNAADQVTELAHELSNLLDGSMRWLSLADRSLPEAEPSPGLPMSETRQHLDHARTALLTMSELVGAAMKPVPIGSPLHHPGVGVSLGQAIDHSVEVARPKSTETEIEIDVSIATLAGQASSGPLYSVILNGVVNAVESIERCREPGAGQLHGRIEIEAGVIETESGRSLMIEIRDDGQGLSEESRNGDWPFVYGHSMKPEGTGVGLAIAKRTIEEVGGSISLTQRTELRLNPERPGARLQIRLPLQGPGDAPIGGESAD